MKFFIASFTLWDPGTFGHFTIQVHNTLNSLSSITFRFPEVVLGFSRLKIKTETVTKRHTGTQLRPSGGSDLLTSPHWFTEDFSEHRDYKTLGTTVLPDFSFYPKGDQTSYIPNWLPTCVIPNNGSVRTFPPYCTLFGVVRHPSVTDSSWVQKVFYL